MAGVVTVTVTWAGLMLTSLMPAGSVTATATVVVPGPSEPTATAPTRLDVSNALSAAVAPPIVTDPLFVDSV